MCFTASSPAWAICGLLESGKIGVSTKNSPHGFVDKSPFFANLVEGTKGGTEGGHGRRRMEP